MDFFAEANGAGQLLLKLVSRGNAILAELLRLSDNIPQGLCLPSFLPLFFFFFISFHHTHFPLLPSVTAYRPENSQQYASLIFDFSYLQNEELYEKRIGENAVCFNPSFFPPLNILQHKHLSHNLNLSGTH